MPNDDSPISVSVDTRRLAQAMARFAQVAGRELADVVRDEARLLIEGTAKITPPRSLAQGRNAVANDLWRLAQPLEAARWLDEGISHLIDSRNVPALEVVFRRVPVRGFKGVSVLEGGQLPEYHRSYRDRRGRVRKPLPFAAFEDDAKKYRRIVQQRVGRSKSGWVPALRHLGSKRIPKWVARHSPPGLVRDTLKYGRNGSLLALNWSGDYGAEGASGLARRVQWAMSRRVRRLENKMARAVRYRARQTGFR